MIKLLLLTFIITISWFAQAQSGKVSDNLTMQSNIGSS